MGQKDYKTKLSELNLDQLKIIARQLKVKNFSHGTKEKLIESILNKPPKQIKKIMSDSFWGRYHNHVYGFIGIIGVALTLYFGIHSSPTNPSNTSNQDTQRVSDSAIRGATSSSTTTPTPIQAASTSSPTPAPSPTSTVKPSPQHDAKRRESASVYISQARALFGKGLYRASLAKINKALSLEPNNEEALSLKRLIVEHTTLVHQ